MHSNCCDEGKKYIYYKEAAEGKFIGKISASWNISYAAYDDDIAADYRIHNHYSVPLKVKFCPFCGKRLENTVKERLEELLKLPTKVTICLDVDGVLADITDLNVPYALRKCYPGVPEIVQKLKAAGHKINIQTARYMFKCSGDQQKAHERGYNELLVWLEQNSIPYDQVYLGKVPADIYVDDRGCRVESVHGDKDWNGHFADVLEETQEKLKDANI